MPVALDESEDHEKNVEGIPNYEIPKSFADESFRLIANDKNDKKSDSGQNSVERDEDNFTFIYHEEIALVAERTKIWFDKFEFDNFLKTQSVITPPCEYIQIYLYISIYIYIYIYIYREREREIDR